MRFTTAGLPVGLQVVGAPLAEAMLFRISHAYERATPWHRRRPVLADRRCSLSNRHRSYAPAARLRPCREVIMLVSSRRQFLVGSAGCRGRPRRAGPVGARPEARRDPAVRPSRDLRVPM